MSGNYYSTYSIRMVCHSAVSQSCVARPFTYRLLCMEKSVWLGVIHFVQFFQILEDVLYMYSLWEGCGFECTLHYTFLVSIP